MIESISGGIAFVAFLTIFIMLVLCINVIKSSLKLTNSYKSVPAAQMKEIAIKHERTHEKTLVYPFYVDYTNSIDPYQKYSSSPLSK